MNNKSFFPKPSRLQRILYKILLRAGEETFEKLFYVINIKEADFALSLQLKVLIGTNVEKNAEISELIKIYTTLRAGFPSHFFVFL